MGSPPQGQYLPITQKVTVAFRDVLVEHIHDSAQFDGLPQHLDLARGGGARRRVAAGVHVAPQQRNCVKVRPEAVHAFGNEVLMKNQHVGLQLGA
jgi:hypothetical protein